MMEKLNNKTSNKDVELLSEEVQEVMNRIPSAIIRWGMTVMAFILGGILIAAAYIRWPQIIECSFEGHQIGNTVVLKTALSPEAMNYLLHRDEQSIRVYSPMFQQKYSSDGITGRINKISTISYSNDHYNTTLTVVMDHNKITEGSIFYGNVQFIVSEKTLLQSIVGSVKSW